MPSGLRRRRGPAGAGLFRTPVSGRRPL